MPAKKKNVSNATKTTKKEVTKDTIIEELDKRAPKKNKNSIERKLIGLLGDIMEKAEGHLSRVHDFLPEFDDHSIKHSDAVLGYIAKIIGEEGIKNLSVYELFILAASSYLHDFGMALTDYGKKIFELAEEKPLPVAIDSIDECVKLVESRFVHQFEDALKTEFLPNKETKLIEFLAKLYQEYQTFRNGYAEEYKKIKEDSKEKDEQKKQEKLNKLNKKIRMDFIRENHPQRSAQYAKNWGSRYEEENPIISAIMNDVAKVVLSHGEPFDYVKKLGIEVPYAAIDDEEDSDKANLQFASMMLRLGDIVHFTFDRAPVSLRREIIFDSPYSKEQWMQKHSVTNKVTKSAEQTKIVFNAKCPSPRSYCYLKKYIGYINQEVDGFNSFKKSWKDRYQIPLVPVEDNIKALNDAFKTKPDLKFTLNQNKIIELLMGTQLYEDPYACLRELYQNSLDACRCAIARRKSSGEIDPKCTIEFGVKEDEGGKYFYCLDDGKGMSEDIIEHYFLKIGSSYYKSKDFYSKWANSGFTPTSQFGIGILSCFMIGERLEVLTKEQNCELIAFGVDGPQETFYYWRDDNHIPLTDKETIERQGSGTLVKVYLKEQYANEIDNGELDKLELLKCCDFRYHFNDLDNYKPSESIDEEETKYVNLFNRWRRHIYKKVYDFVQLPFPEIAVQVLCANTPLLIEPRPHLADVDLTTYEKDKKYYNEYSSGFWRKYSDWKGYPIDISHFNFKYHSMLCLPTKEEDSHNYNEYAHSGFCVDGVSINGPSFEYSAYKDSLNRLAEKGIFNFVGEHKPAVKIDRCSFVNDIHIEDPEQLFSKYLDEVIRITKEHIERYHIPAESPLYQKIWDMVISGLPFPFKTLLTNRFDEKYPQINSTALSEFMGENGTVSEWMTRESIKVKVQRERKHYETDAFLIKKLTSVKSASFTLDGDLQLTFGELPQLPYFNCDVADYVVGLPEDIGPYQDYDILISFYPLVSHRLAKALEDNVTVESSICIGEFSSRIQDWYHSSLFVRRGCYLNKEFSIMANTEKGFDYLIYCVSDNFSYVSLCDRRESCKEYSIILPKKFWDNRFIVVEGKLTREEMDEIVDHCRYML